MLNSGTLILVTGASGFIGSNFTVFLLSKGFKVRAVYRKHKITEKISIPHTGKLEEVQADFTNVKDLKQIVQGCDIVVHAAGLAFDWGDYADFKKNNYTATVNIVDAAKNFGCGRFIYISSAAIHGFGRHIDTTEDGPYYALKSPYPITKMMAEKYVLDKNSSEFSTIAIRPGNVYGPGDRTSTYEMFAQIFKGVMGYIGKGKYYTCPIYIDDLCEGIFAAITAKNIEGTSILLTDGEKVEWKDYVQRMFEVVGSSKHPVNLPVPLAYLAAYLFKFVYKGLRIKQAPPLTLYRVEQASNYYHFNNERARKLLNFSPSIFYREGLALTAEAFIKENNLQK